MSSSPWRPPGLAAFGNLPISFGVNGGGTLEEDRVLWTPSHRIIASEYAGENLFDRLTDGAGLWDAQGDLEAFREIADLTNPHVLSEAGHIELIRPEDRIFGSGAGLIMAAFAFPGGPSRFSDGGMGAYYAAREPETAIAETVFHDEKTLRGSGPCVVEKTLIHADLDASLVDLREGSPCPPGIYDLDDYSAAQAFGGIVRHLEGYGICYDSVRRDAGECVAIFRPPALHDARAVQELHYEWDGVRIMSVR